MSKEPCPAEHRLRYRPAPLQEVPAKDPLAFPQGGEPPRARPPGRPHRPPSRRIVRTKTPSRAMRASRVDIPSQEIGRFTTKNVVQCFAPRPSLRPSS